MKYARWMIASGVVLASPLLGAAAGAAGPARIDGLREVDGFAEDLRVDDAARAADVTTFCAVDPDPPVYYQLPLVTTKNVPGSARATGVADVTYAATSPFGVSVSPDGSYSYDVHVAVEDLRAPDRGVYTVWVTTSQIDRIQRVGVLGEDGTATGRVDWNKFLVVITLEPEDDPEAETWSGPVVLRGMSRSGMMHTMAGHGPFQQENCAAYGYDD